MAVFIFTLCVLFGGCRQEPAVANWQDIAAGELALAIVEGDGPAPAAPAPGPGPDDTGALPQGWIISDARDLIAKGNALADRGKAILDAAERDGKVTVDVRLPGGAKKREEASGRKPPANSLPLHGSECTGGVCRPRLLPWRR
jgi:hypothetical protein